MKVVGKEKGERVKEIKIQGNKGRKKVRDGAAVAQSV
jgi:hypothetical protein